MANGKVVGIVKSIIGNVQVIDKNGNIRTLEVGGYLYEGEKVISDDANALLQIKYLEFPDIKNYTGVFAILVDSSVARVANEDVNSINKNDLANMTETEAGQENSAEHFLPSSFQSVAAQNVFEIDRGKKTTFGDGIIDSGKTSKILYDGGDQSPPVFLSNNVVIYNEESDEVIIDINTSDTSSVSFSIEEGLDSSLFSIESTTGVLQFTFIPDFENPQDDNGDNEYNVAVTATDVYGNYTTQMLSIFINNINDNRPESLSESFASIEDTTDLISGQLYGKDADGNSFTYVLVENVAEGELTFSSDGQYVFSVGEDFQDLGLGETRAVTFTYKTVETLTPEGFESDIATITITVTGTNDIPFAQIDERVTTENTNIVIDVLANDTDIDTTATFTLDNVSVAVGQGSVSIVENQLVFNLENDFDYLAVDESTQVSISYEMSDEHGAKSSSIVLVTVVGRNDQPVVYGVNVNENPEIIPQVEKMFYETDGTETVYVGQLKVSDLDVTDTHVFQLIENSVNVVTNSGVSVENLKVVVNGDGVFEIIGNFDHLSDNETASVTFQYVAIDDSGVEKGDVLNQQDTSAPKSVTLTMTGTNDQPIVSDVIIMDLILESDNIQTVYQGQLFLREDLDSTDTHTFQLVSGSQRVQTSGAVIDNFSVMLNLDGHYEVSGNFDHLSESETALIEFKYTAMDDSNTENAVSQEKRVQLTVTGMNDRPEVSDVTILDTLNATDGYATIYKGVLNVKDIDTSDTHIFKLVNNTLHVVTTNGVVLDNIDVSVDENGAYKVNGNLDALNNNESATISFQYLAIDNSQTNSSTAEAKTVMLTVNGKDNVTTIHESSVATGKTFEDSMDTVTGKIDASDLDMTDNYLTYKLNTTQGVYGEISIDMLSGVWAYIIDNTRNVTQALENDQQVRESFIVTVTTKQGETVSQTITIDLVGTNDTPMIATVLAVETKEDAAVIYGKLIANDIDQNAVLTYSAAAVAGFTLNGQTGEYSFDLSNENYQYLNAGDSLTVTISVSVMDEHGAKATTNIIINMTGTNDIPVIDLIDEVSVNEDGVIVHGKVTSSDIDQNAVHTYSAAAVAGFTLNGQTGEYSFDPSNENYQYLNAGDSLTVTIPVSVTDEHGAKATTNIIINMTGMNEAPTLEMSVSATTNVNELALKIFSETSEQGSVFLEFGGIPEGSKIFTPQGEDVSGGIENYSGEHLFILVFPEDVDSFGTLRVTAKDAITNTQAVEELALAYDINSASSLIKFDQNDQSMWGSDIDATLGWHEYIPFIGEAPIKWNETTQQWDDTSEGSEWRSGIFNIIDVDLDAKSIGQKITDWVNDVREKADLVGKNLEAWANYTLKKIAYEAANIALKAGVTIKDGVLEAAKWAYDKALGLYQDAHNATEAAKYALDHSEWYEYIPNGIVYGAKWGVEQLAYAAFKTAEFAYDSAKYLTERAEEALLEPLERAVEDTRLAMNEAWGKALAAEKAMHDEGYYTDRSVEINDSGITVVDGAAVAGELLVAEAANLAYNTAYNSGAFDFGLDLQANAELFARVGMQVDFVLDAGSVDTNINYLLTSTSQYNATTDMLVLNPMMKNMMTNEDVAFSTISPNLQFYVALLYDVGLDFTYQLDEAYLKALGTTIFEADPIEKTTITVSTNSMASDSEMKSGELVLVDLDTRDLGSVNIPFIDKLASALKDDSAEASSLKNSLLDQLTQGMLSVEIGFPTIETEGKVTEYSEDFYKEGDLLSVDVAELTEAIFNMVNAKLDYTQEFKDLYGVGDLNPASIDDFIVTFVSALGQYMIDAYGRTEGVPIFELDMKGNSTSALFHVNTFPDSYTMEGLNADSGSFGFFTAEGEGNVPLVKVSLDIDQVVAFIVNAIVSQGATTTSSVPELNPLDLEIGLDYLLELAGMDEGSRNEITKYIDIGINIEAADLDAYADVNFTQQFALSVDDMEFQMTLEDGTIFKFNANQEESLAIENASMYDKDGNGILDYSLQIIPDANFYNDTEAKLGLGYALDLLKADFNAGVKIPLADILNMKDTKTSLPTIDITAINYAVGPLLTIQGDLDVLSMDVFESRFDMDVGSHTYANSVDIGFGEMKSASMYVDDHGIAGV